MCDLAESGRRDICRHPPLPCPGTEAAALSPGERPFPCAVCEKAFNQKSALQVHMKKHTGERPYRCGVCALGFTQKSNMKLHMRRAHSCTGAGQGAGLTL